jgi:molybdenum transport protein
MSANIPLAQLERLLFDDAPYGDLTTDLLGIGAQRGRMTFSARGPMVLALATEAAELLEMAGASVERLVEDGQALTPGQEFLRAEGQAGALLRGWKVAQTLVEIWSGVATGAREIVEAARAVAPDIGVACTRKNTPGLKNFSVAAIRAGGAEMHRLGLSETILVFPDHLAFLAGETLDSVVARLRRGAPEKKLVLEAGAMSEALAGAEAGFDVIQAEKFSPAEIALLINQLAVMQQRPKIAAAGGVNRANAAEYATAGADILVTSAPYAAPPRDVYVRFTPSKH